MILLTETGLTSSGGSLMDSVKTIMENSNKLLAKALKFTDNIDISFKSAELLKEQNVLQTLFSSKYSDDELAKQKIRCVNAYVYLEYAMLPYDEECKRNYYTRCEITDLYDKCKKFVRSADGKEMAGGLSVFIANCYKPASMLHESAILSTGVMDIIKFEEVKQMFSSVTAG